MNTNFKPIGYNSVSPYFIVEDAKKFMELLTNIFNATEMRKFNMPDGSIMHAEMQIDDSIIMLGNSSDQFPPITLVVHVYVKNVEEIFEKAIAHGCVSVETPKQREGDADRRGTFTDFAGNMWSVSTQLD